jgi:hypothetical protein
MATQDVAKLTKATHTNKVTVPCRRKKWTNEAASIFLALRLEPLRRRRLDWGS